MLKRIWETYEKHERRISSLGLVVGFIVDSLTLSGDYSRDVYVFFVYFALLGSAIFLLNLVEGGYLSSAFWKRAHTALMFIIQLFIGGLFSGFVVIYGRSASIFSSALFLLILAGMLIGNEFVKKHYARMTLHMSIYFMAIFSFLIFFVPVVIGKIGSGIFMLSGIASLVVFGIFIYLLSLLVPLRVRADRNLLLLTVGGIFFLVNALYFLKIIPPLPLSLKTAEVYHSIVRNSGGEYEVKRENQPWYSFMQVFERVHVQSGDRLYLFSSVFAPTSFETEILHEWLYYDEAASAWKLSSRVQFPVSGGREKGYRGYSYKDNLFPGLWRVDVKTPNGQKLGNVKFKIVPVSNPPALLSDTL